MGLNSKYKKKILFIIFLILLMSLFLVSCTAKNQPNEKTAVIQDKEFLAKAQQYEQDFSKLRGGEKGQLIDLAVTLQMCAQNSDYCYVGDSKEKLLNEYKDLLNLNIQKAVAYKERFTSYKVSQKYEQMRQDFIEETDLNINWFNAILTKLDKNDFDPNIFTGANYPSWKPLADSRYKIVAEWKNLDKEAELQSI